MGGGSVAVGGGSVSVGGGSMAVGGSATGGGGSASAGAGAGGSIATGTGTSVDGDSYYTDLYGFKEEDLSNYGDYGDYDEKELDYDGKKDGNLLPAITDEDLRQVSVTAGRWGWCE